MAESSLRMASVLVFCALALPAGAAENQHFESAPARVAQVLDLMNDRMALMPGVAAWKWQNSAPIYDPERERVVAARAGEVADTMGIAAADVQALFDLQIRVAREVQAALHERWRNGRFDFAPPVPDLQTEIRPKLDEITVELLEALYLATLEVARPDFETLHAAEAEQRLTAAGWTAAHRKEALAALGALRRVDRPPLQRIRASGVLRVGLTGDYAPFSLERDGELSGADVELAQSLAERFGVRPVFVRTTWAGLMDDLQAGRFDLAMGGISVTPAREAVAAFSVPYASGGKTAISRCSDVKRFRDLKAVDRRPVRVVVNPGGTNEQFVRSRIRQAQVRVFPDNRAIFDEIRAGRADVMITDDVEVELQTRRHKDLCRAFPGTLTHADKAILMPRDPDLLAAVNRWLAGSIQSGVPGRLIDQHLSSP